MLKTKVLYVALIFTLLFPFFLPLGPNAKAATVDDPVATFSDPNLNAAIHLWLGIPETDSIKKSDIQNKVNRGETLKLESKNISNLSGMEIFAGTGIQEINLNFNSIQDLSPLKDITELKTLDIASNKVSDLTPINKLVNLELLWAWENNVSDITPLANLTSLKTISLSSNNVSDLNPLKDLSNLYYLDVSTNKISDLSPIKNLTNLNVLELRRNQITDITPLENLKNLSQLDISTNNVQDISVISNFFKMEDLELSQTLVKDVSPVNGLVHLWNLNMAYTLVTDITVLNYLPSLRDFTVHDNYINVFSGANKAALDALPGTKDIGSQLKYGVYDTNNSNWVNSINLNVNDKISPFKHYRTNNGQDFIRNISFVQSLIEYFDVNTTFSSADSEIAKVDNRGEITGVSTGKTTITAHAFGINSEYTTYQIEVTVNDPTPTLKRLEVTPKTATIKVGDSQQYIATAVYSDGSTKNVTDESSWYVQNSDIADMNKGLTTGENPGTTTVTAFFEGLSDNANLNVEKDMTPSPISVIGLEVTPKTATIYVGEKQEYRATALYSDGTKKDVTTEAIWNTQDTDIADINKGSANGKKTGSTLVNVSFEEQSDSATLIVINRPTPSATLEKFEVTPETATVYVGEKQQYKAIATYSDGSIKDVTNQSIWTISNKDLANINNQGLAEGNKKGETSVVAEFQGVADDAALIIKEKEISNSTPEEPKQQENPQDPPAIIEQPSQTMNVQVPGVPKTGDGSSEPRNIGALIILLLTILTTIIFYIRRNRINEN